MDKKVLQHWPLLALFCGATTCTCFSEGFLHRPLTLLTRQTRKAVCAINQPMYLSCLWPVNRCPL